jgi:hypothetical protein
MQGWFNICKLINTIVHINKSKGKNHIIIQNHIIILIDAEKALDKIQHCFVIKVLKKFGLEGSYLNIIKAIYDRPVANIPNEKKLKAFLLKSE